MSRDRELARTREDLALTLGALHRIGDVGEGERTCAEIAALAEGRVQSLLASLKAERDAHQVTQAEKQNLRQCLDNVREGAAALSQEHEETKRQLARERELVCEVLCGVGYDGMRHHRLCEEVRRG